MVLSNTWTQHRAASSLPQISLWLCHLPAPALPLKDPPFCLTLTAEPERDPRSPSRVPSSGTCSVPATTYLLSSKEPGLMLALVSIAALWRHSSAKMMETAPLSHSGLFKKKKKNGWSTTQPISLPSESAQREALKKLPRARLLCTTPKGCETGEVFPGNVDFCYSCLFLGCSEADCCQGLFGAIDHHPSLGQMTPGGS